MSASQRRDAPSYNEAEIAALFDRMGPSYDLINRVASFGFCELWRAQCVSNFPLHAGAVVIDLMAGSGECWPYIQRKIRPSGRILSVDFSPVMCGRQRQRNARYGLGAAPVEILCENALSLALPEAGADYVVSAFGLKTFDTARLHQLAAETFRLLKPGGSCSFLEISVPPAPALQWPYLFYIDAIVPAIGRMLLGDIECYRMLGSYTKAFVSCSAAVEAFRSVGFSVQTKSHFFGCATSLIGKKPD